VFEGVGECGLLEYVGRVARDAQVVWFYALRNLLLFGATVHIYLIAPAKRMSERMWKELDGLLWEVPLELGGLRLSV
jgi:hypothetical protein